MEKIIVDANTDRAGEHVSSRTPERQRRMREVLLQRQNDLTLVLANIHDPHNVSAIYRSCDAFGVACVHLYYTSTAFPALGKKSSASARKWVESRRHADIERMFTELHASNMNVLATTFSKNASPLWEVDLTGPTAIVLGNEHAGVEAELVERADGELYIPMRGMIQSLNVSVAAAVILAEASRQRSGKGLYDRNWADSDELKLAQWLEK